MSAILGSVLIDIWDGPAPPPVKAQVELLYKPGQSAAAARILPNQSTMGSFYSTAIVAWADAHTIADGYRALIGTVVALTYHGANYGNVLVQDVDVDGIELMLFANGLHPDGNQYTYNPAGRIYARWKIVRLAYVIKYTMATIDYSSGPRVTDVGDSVVYTKATWAGSWVEQPNLVCTECQWRAAPDFNTALLTWRTGYIIPPGSTSTTLYTPWTSRGHFVRIDWQCEDNTILRWVGFIDSSSWPTDAWGDQQLVCFGLERALALTPIIDLAFKRSTSVLRSGVPAEFGFNRSKDPDSSGGVYLFCDLMRDDLADRKQWSTREIVRYLLKYHCPSSNFGVGSVSWSIDQQAQLPDWDGPTIECANRTVWDVLNELISPSKQLGFTVGSNGSTAFLRAFTHTGSDITIGSRTLLANPNQHELILSPDALTSASLADVGGGYDQVICRGARRQTICTLSYTDHIEDDWESSNETAYEAGASALANYSTANTQKQREMNMRERTHWLLNKVYSEFRIIKTFDWVVATEDLFPDNTTPRAVWIEDKLPIRPDVDWSGTVDPTHLDRYDTQPWRIYFAKPDDLLKYVDLSTAQILAAESVSNGDKPTITVSAETRGLGDFRLTVNGAPQHAIAGTNFSRLPVDAPAKAWGNLDYTTMRVTCALEEDRYCEARYPDPAPSVDIVRRLLVDCGPEYKQIRIHKDTITGLDHEGTAKKVTASDYLVDDSPKLAALAQIIALGAILSRKRVNWTSQRRISTIAVGDFINTAEGEDIFAVVTAITINAPTSIDRPASCPTQSFTTFGGTHDPLAVLRNLGMVL